MPHRTEFKNKPYGGWTLKMLKKEVNKYRALFHSSLAQMDELQYLEVELETYKGYLTDTRERLKKVRKERDLAIQLLHIRTTSTVT